MAADITRTVLSIELCRSITYTDHADYSKRLIWYRICYPNKYLSEIRARNRFSLPACFTISLYYLRSVSIILGFTRVSFISS